MLADYSGIILGKKIGNENENNTWVCVVMEFLFVCST